MLLYLAITSWTSEHSPPPKFRSSLRLLLRGQFGIYSGSLGTQVEQLTFSSITWGLAWEAGGREKRTFAQSHSRMSREAWAAGLGRPGASEQLDFPQSAGKQLSHFQASGKEGRGIGGVYRVSWSPSGPRGTRHCKNRAQLLVRLSDPGPRPPGIMTPWDSLLPRPSVSTPDTSRHSLLLPDQGQAPWPSPDDPPLC